MINIRNLDFMHKYFAAEKQESFWFMLIGLTAIVLATCFLIFVKTNTPFFRGVAIPFIVLGLLQAIVGYTVYARTDKQRNHIAYKMGMEPARFIQSEELPRMKKVMKNFALYKWLEIAFAVAGIVLILCFRTNEMKQSWYGLGIALLFQSLLLLAGDFIAAKRGGAYVRGLERVISE